eukprot:2306197-Alexandrium_andersonii.AAC.1
MSSPYTPGQGLPAAFGASQAQNQRGQRGGGSVHARTRNVTSLSPRSLMSRGTNCPASLATRAGG